MSIPKGSEDDGQGVSFSIDSDGIVWAKLPGFSDNTPSWRPSEAADPETDEAEVHRLIDRIVSRQDKIATEMRWPAEAVAAMMEAMNRPHVPVFCPLCHREVWAGEEVMKQNGAHLRCVADAERDKERGNAS